MISYGLAQSDHIKRCLLYKRMTHISFFGVPHLASFIFVILIACNSLALLTSIQYTVTGLELTTS